MIESNALGVSGCRDGGFVRCDTVKPVEYNAFEYEAFETASANLTWRGAAIAGDCRR